jgi:hypothetical protein
MKDEASYVCDSLGEEIIVPIDMPLTWISDSVKLAKLLTSSSATAGR